MDAESVLARIAENPRLPTPPALTLRVLERANRPSCSIAELGKLISVDPAMCGRMLKLVNSSLYGLQRPVTSIERALNLLGVNHVRSLVLGLSLPSLRFQRASSEEVRTYWKSSVTMAIVCRELALHLNWPDADSEMVAGLLCDFGVLLLQETFPEQASAESKEKWFENQCTQETERYGVDHAEAGAYFLKRWNLADEVTQAIRYHHRPADAPPDFRERATMLSFANHTAHLHLRGNNIGSLTEVIRLGEERYRMDADHLIDFLESLHEKIREFATLIDIDVGPRQSYADLFAQSTENLTRLAVQASLDNVRVQQEKSQVEQHLEGAKQALRVSEQQLWQAQKMDAIGRLAGGVAHDFNNLLAVINGTCELLEVRNLDAETRELVAMIQDSGKRAAGLTQQLLAFGRKQRLKSDVMDLNAIVLNMNKLLARLVGSLVELTTDLAVDLMPVKIDGGQMEQVIVNLAVNARDAMPDGGSLSIETFNLEVGADLAAQNNEMVPGHYVVLAVRDTGHGMDETVLKRIFEPFFTTKEHGKGTGLGLASVHGIVRQSGGHITVASTVGVGTIFHIYLPAATEPIAPVLEGVR